MVRSRSQPLPLLLALVLVTLCSLSVHPAAAAYSATNACPGGGLCRVDQYACDSQLVGAACNPGSAFVSTVSSTTIVAGTVANTVKVESEYGGATVHVPAQPNYINSMLSKNLTHAPWFWFSGTNGAVGNWGGQDDITVGRIAFTVQPSCRGWQASWTDPTNGDIYMYGGATVGGAILNDFYRWHRDANAWELVMARGLTDQGTRLVTASNVYPGPRAFACSAVDTSSGLAYVFGGATSSGGSTTSSELFTYNSTINQWTYLSGTNNNDLVDNTATIGFGAAASTTPGVGSRRSPACYFSQGHFIVVGGMSHDNKLYQDVWSYDVGQDTWWYVGGSNAIADGDRLTNIASEPLPFRGAAYAGPINSVGNYPMFLHGGDSFDQSPQSSHMGQTDALWQLDFSPSSPPSIGWTFLRGSSHIVNAPVGTTAQYGVQDQFAALTFPTARSGHAMIIDPMGTSLWMFGGDAAMASGLGQAYQSDLWCFSIALSQWKYVRGPLNGGADVGMGMDAMFFFTDDAQTTARPNVRHGHSMHLDRSAGIWIMFGAATAISSPTFVHSDVWRLGAGLGLVDINTVVSSGRTICLPGSCSPILKPGLRTVPLLEKFKSFTMYTQTEIVDPGPPQNITLTLVPYYPWTWVPHQVGRSAHYPCDQEDDPPCVPGSEFTLAVASLTTGGYYHLESKYGGGTVYVPAAALPTVLSLASECFWVRGVNALDPPDNNVATVGLQTYSVVPGGRFSGASWVDSVTGDLMYHGGFDGSAPRSEVFQLHRSEAEWELRNAGTFSADTTTAAMNPGVRIGHCAAHDPATGFTYLFGGLNQLSQPDGRLFRYDNVHQNYTFLGGAGLNGEPDTGVAAAASVPASSVSGANGLAGARSSVACWFSQGHFLVFGGNSQGTRLSSLWAVDVATDEWYFVSGHNGGTGSEVAAGAYSVANGLPWPAFDMAFAGPAADGAMYMHGGDIGNGTAGGFSDQLWKLTFNAAAHTAVWTLLKGAAVPAFPLVGTTAQYGTPGSTSPGNLPTDRAGHRMVVDLTSSQLYIFGGSSLGASTPGVRGFNDESEHTNALFWRFDIASGDWAFIRGYTDGSNPHGWGLKQFQSPSSNWPNERVHHAMWSDRANNIWIAFGVAGGTYNDVFKVGSGSGSILLQVTMRAGQSACTAHTPLPTDCSPFLTDGYNAGWTMLEIGKPSSFYMQTSSGVESMIAHVIPFDKNSAGWRMEHTLDGIAQAPCDHTAPCTVLVPWAQRFGVITAVITPAIGSTVVSSAPGYGLSFTTTFAAAPFFFPFTLRSQSTTVTQSYTILWNYINPSSLRWWMIELTLPGSSEVFGPGLLPGVVARINATGGDIQDIVVPEELAYETLVATLVSVSPLASSDFGAAQSLELDGTGTWTSLWFSTTAEDGTSGDVHLTITVDGDYAQAADDDQEQAPIVFIMAEGTDGPCSGDLNPCLNDAWCSEEYVNSNGQNATVHVTCECQEGFFTPTCAVGFVDCVDCVASYDGGSTLRLEGIGLASSIRRVRLGNVVVPQFNLTNGATGRMTSRSLQSWWDDEEDVPVDELVFRSPAIPLRGNSSVNPGTGMRYSSYVSLEVTVSINITNAQGVTVPQVLAYKLRGVVWATPNQCVAAGQWKASPDGGCLACPTGGHCPGGGRVWPVYNYWSVNEYSAPRRCPMPDTCLGTSTTPNSDMVRMANTGATDTSTNVTMAKLTQKCVAGYTDLECIKCDRDYYQLSGRCYACPSAETQIVQLTLVLFAAGCVILALSLAVSFLNGSHLSVMVMLFVLLQRVTALGSSGSRDLPKNAQQVATFFSLVNVINFNVEIVNPGCAVRALNWIGLFWATMLIVLITYLCFMAAAFLRFLVNRAKLARRGGKLSPGEVDPTEDFRRRRTHVTIIAGSLFYLKIVSLQVAGFRCAAAPVASDRSLTGPTSEGLEPSTSNYLSADMETKCWQGVHAFTMAFILFSLLFFTIGFPLWIALTLRSSFGAKVVDSSGSETEANETDDDEGNTKLKVGASSTVSGGASLIAASLRQYRMDCYGVMFRGLRPSQYLFKLSQFPVSVWFAVVSALLVSDVPLQLFLLGISAAVQSALAIGLMPFIQPHSNWLLIGTSMGTLAYTVMLLLLQPGGLRVTSLILVGLFVLCAFGLLARLCTKLTGGSKLVMSSDGVLRKVKVEDLAETEMQSPAPPQKRTVKTAFVEMQPTAADSAQRDEADVDATTTTIITTTTTTAKRSTGGGGGAAAGAGDGGKARPTVATKAAARVADNDDPPTPENHIWGVRPAAAPSSSSPAPAAAPVAATTKAADVPGTMVEQDVEDEE